MSYLRNSNPVPVRGRRKAWPLCSPGDIPLNSCLTGLKPISMIGTNCCCEIFLPESPKNASSEPQNIFAFFLEMLWEYNLFYVIETWLYHASTYTNFVLFHHQPSNKRHHKTQSPIRPVFWKMYPFFLPPSFSQLSALTFQEVL